jgi:hypothetical protein
MSGHSILNIGAVDIPSAFINIMKAFGSINFAGVSPSVLDSNGYPNTTLASNLGGIILLPAGMAGNSIQWVAKWPASRNIKFVINNPVNEVSSSGATVTGGTNSVMTVASTGAAGRVVFTLSNYSSTNISFYFPSGFANGGSGELAIVRATDEAAYDAGTYFTPEFIALLQDLNPKTIRPMGWRQTGPGNLCNRVQYGYRTMPSYISWNSAQYPPSAWGGTVSGTDTYTMGAAPDTPGSWTDGEIIQGVVTNANTSTTPTLNVNSRGAKTIVTMSNGAISAGAIAAGSTATFIYDGILNKVLWSAGSLTAEVPTEAMVQLANTLGCNLWLTIPPMANDDFVTQDGTYVRDHLNSSLLAYFEYGNEIWNFAFPQTSWAGARGTALGFTSSNNEHIDGWYGLRFRQIAGTLTSLWGARANLRRVIAFQAFGNTSSTSTYRIGGADLQTGVGHAGYDALIGVNYNSAPNRPGDYADVLSYATYYSGANFVNADGNYSTASTSFLQTLCDQYASGDATQLATALVSLDTDIRSGTRSSVLGSQTLLGLSNVIYPGWETIANTWGKNAECYEGALECVAPSTAKCTTLGLTEGGTAAGANAALVGLLAAYKNSAKYQIIVRDQFNQFMSQTHSVSPCWLTITGANQWSLLSGDIFSTPYQTYYGFKNYNNNKRRMVIAT